MSRQNNLVDFVEQLPQIGDIAIIATKLNDAQQVMNDLAHVAGGSLPIVCASNGVQGERWAKELFDTVLSMLVWLPSTHLRPGDVRVYLDSKCAGVLDVGPSQGKFAIALSSQLSGLLRNAKFDSVDQLDIARWKYAKLITNLGSAAQAMVVDDWKSVADLSRAEGEQILSSLKIDRVLTKTLLDRVSQLELLTIDGEPRLGGSTWQSRQRGKPLESEWIEGEIARLAEAGGLKAPVNQFLSKASQSPRDLLAKEVTEIAR